LKFSLLLPGKFGKEMNNLIFEGITPLRDSWKARVISINLLRFRVSQNLESTISLFIDRLYINFVKWVYAP
jgi:hypothetical protein